jgi:hypothetical protein
MVDWTGLDWTGALITFLESTSLLGCDQAMCESMCCYASKFVQDLMTIDTLQKLELLVCQSWRGFRFS